MNLISQINNFEYCLNKIDSKFINNFDFFDIGIKFHFLYDWLQSKWTNIKNLLEFYEQIIKLIDEQEKISESGDLNIKFNSKKHTYITHIYSIIYEFLKLKKYDLRDHESKLNENSLPYILDKTINLIKSNNIINCNIDNPFEFEVKKTEKNKKSNIYTKFKNDFFNKFIDYTQGFQIRNNTFHLNNERKDSPWYKDVLIDKIDKLSSWTVDDIKQVITYLKDLIIKPYSFLWNFMRKITNNNLMCSFEELLKVYF